MRKLIVVPILLLLHSVHCYAVNVTKVAAITTIGINVLQAPATFKKSKEALRKTKHVIVKGAKKVVGK